VQAKTLPCTPDMYIAVSNNENEDYLLNGKIWSPSGLEPKFRMWNWKPIKDGKYFIFPNRLHARIVKQAELRKIKTFIEYVERKLPRTDMTFSEFYASLYDRYLIQRSLFENAEIVKI